MKNLVLKFWFLFFFYLNANIKRCFLAPDYFFVHGIRVLTSSKLAVKSLNLKVYTIEYFQAYLETCHTKNIKKLL